MSETRMQKYQKLRDSIRDDVRVEQPEMIVDESEDDFLAFLPKSNVDVNEDNFKPKNYSDIKKDAKTEEALSFVKNSADNTKVDIFRQIRSEDHQRNYGPYGPIHSGDLDSGHEVKREDKQSTFIDRIIAMSPDEDVEEFRKFQEEEKSAQTLALEDQEETPVDTFVAKKVDKEEETPVVVTPKESKPKKEKKEKPQRKTFIEVEEEDEGDSREALITNIIIAVLVIIFIVVLVKFFFM